MRLKQVAVNAAARRFDSLPQGYTDVSFTSVDIFTADCGLTTLHRENKEFSSKVRALAALAFLPFYQIPEIL